MDVQLLLVMTGALIIAAFAHLRGLQAGIVTVTLAAAISFIPGLPRLELDPELILGVVIPPLLYSATLNFSFFAFVKNLRSILGLGVGLVVFTTVVVGFLTSWLSPELGLAGAFVLAAVVSPPDSVTTVSHGREIGLPRRTISILTGESLVNDAAALTLFAVAVAAVTGDSEFIENPFLLFAWEAVIGLILGVVIGRVVIAVRSKVGNPTIESGLNLLVPFLAYFAAEQLHASGIIAVVAAGFTVSMSHFHTQSSGTPSTAYRTRLQESALWPVVDLILEAFVFAYMGLQFRFVLEDLADSSTPTWSTIGLGLIVLLAVVLCRFAWVYFSYGRAQLALLIYAKRMAASLDPMARRRERRRGGPDRTVDGRSQRADRSQRTQRSQRPDSAQRLRIQQRLDSAQGPQGLDSTGGRGAGRGGRPGPGGRQGARDGSHITVLTPPENLLVSWTGMRGIITLAAAGGIPLTIASGAPFPGRTIIQTVAFIVAVGTLLLQGSTLPWLAKRLKIDTTAEDAEVEEGRAAARAVAAIAVAGRDDPTSGEYFDLQRAALTEAVMARQISPASAGDVRHEIDSLQAGVTPLLD
ncbi:cation:proton antiporter [Cryobacterium arcticum]|uniref:Sodium:proton antiporter n=1 Tax=Cryobacterium arcticum TaxID=670052 RepID=A0A317ZWY3_9MICO|nr:sodium:proton antiporter [Cryobacterium arcticum]PXA71809.1 sodium:proton antiporter [Cryobacterium arcticum]